MSQDGGHWNIDRRIDILRCFLKEGFNLSPEALSLLEKVDDEKIREIVKKFAEEPNKKIVITRAHLNQYVDLEPATRIRRPPAAEYDSDIKVIKAPGDDLHIKGEVDDFVKYFRDRYRKIREIIVNRYKIKFMEIQDALNSKDGSDVSIVGIISDVRTSKSKNTIITLEDETGEITVIIRYKDFSHRIFLKDEVVGVVGRKLSKKTVIAQRILEPDTKPKKIENKDTPLAAALISDLHIGSKYFLEKVFRKFLEWIKQRDSLSGRIKYLVIAGDLVDGIGVYPSQERELKIKDVQKQFKYAASLLSYLPDYIKVILIPGNHDPVRDSDPQPPIPEDYLSHISSAVDLLSLGNPAYISIEGVEFLIYHGRSLNSWQRYTPQAIPLTRKSSLRMLELMLRKRHLAPVYGETPITPLSEDWLVIDRVPDVIHCGHIHVNALGRYKGVTLVNSGTFQGETPYIEQQGITVTPGIVPVIQLANLNVIEENFA
ncbi:MAG: DNA-directed DNA polymerase II small subunit [Thermoproteota archaeon]|nr:MAG: DNA-directed DNA polymerase II small subunit [Candidatus Korarchaeota archaeon]